MTSSAAASAEVLADLLLKHVEPSQQANVIKSVAARLYERQGNGGDLATAHLTAQLLRKCPEENAHKSLLSYLQTTILTDINNERESEVAFIREFCEFSNYYPEFGSELIESAEEYITAFPNCGNQEGDERDDEGENKAASDTAITRYLAFLKVSSWLDSGVKSRISLSLLSSILNLLHSHSSSLAYAAKEALFPFLDIDRAEHQHSLLESIWSHVKNLSLSEKECHRSIAFALWLKWTLLPGEPNTRMISIEQERYWELLQNGLRAEQSEHRKQCLFILMKTIPLITRSVSTAKFSFNVEEKKRLEQQWAKYCTFFEILVLERAANQVEDALREFRQLTGPQSGIHGSWLTLMFGAGLAPTVQENVRKLVMSFLIGLKSIHDIHFLTVDREFLTDTFLPYISAGYHFSSTLTQEDRQPVSKHGNSISQFIKQLLRSCTDESSKLGCARTIIHFLHARGEYLFAPARAYLLFGLADGLENEKLYFENRDLDMIGGISLFRRYTEFLRDMFVIVSQRLYLSFNLNGADVKFDQLIRNFFISFSGQEKLISPNFMKDFVRSYRVEIVSYSRKVVAEADSGKELSMEPAHVSFLVHLLHMNVIKECSLADSLISLMSRQNDCPSFLKSLTSYDSSLTIELISSSTNLSESLSSFVNNALKLLEKGDVVPDFSDIITKLASIYSNHSTNEFGLRKVIMSKIRPLSMRVLSQDHSRTGSYDLRTENAEELWMGLASIYLDDVEKPSLSMINWGNVVSRILSTMKYRASTKYELRARDKYLASSFRLLQNLIQKQESISTTDEKTILSDLADLFERSTQFMHETSLLSAISCTNVVFDTFESSNDGSGTVERIIGSLWESCEWLDFPKDAVIAMPRILFHRFVLSLDRVELTPLLHKTMDTLAELAVGKSYIFPALASALRRAFILLPEQLISRAPVQAFMENTINNLHLVHLDIIIGSTLVPRLQKSIPSLTYESYYGDTQAFGLACIFDILNRLHSYDLDFAKGIFHNLMQPWKDQKASTPVVSKWKKTTQLQAMIILASQGVLEGTEEIRKENISKFLKILFLEPLPRYRHLLEWVIARQLLEHIEDRKILLDTLSTSDHSNPKFLTSVLKVSITTVDFPNTTESFAHKLISLVMPLAVSSKAVLRYMAQWAFLDIWDCAENNGWKSITQSEILLPLEKFIRNVKKEFQDVDSRRYGILDPIHDHNLTHLFEGKYLSLPPPEAMILTRDDLLDVLAQDTELPETILQNRPGAMPLGERPWSETKQPIATNKNTSESDPNTTSATPQPTGGHTPLQTKSGTWRAAAETLHSIDASEDEQNSLGRRPHELILVASLIENPFNIGGLSRVAEIFGARSLQVRDRGVMTNAQFTSVAVSSHCWLPIEELPPASIPEFLTQRKLEGYTVVGIEQTDRSKVLGEGDWKLPNKTVLLLGSEREGIPAPLLAEMDLCVEIKQIGQTRSMNVQTAAAVVLYEYSRQHD